ncbi:transposase [Streptomyces vinaceus]|uniref:transposase n=1 Tax=Streptomyces vinaceus TaxID=1960 RepID=UPI003815D525
MDPAHRRPGRTRLPLTRPTRRPAPQHLTAAPRSAGAASWVWTGPLSEPVAEATADLPSLGRPAERSGAPTGWSPPGTRRRSRAVRRCRLQSLLKQAGRVRGIQVEAERLHEVFKRDDLHQLPQVEAALGQSTSALLRQLNTACDNADQLEEAVTQAFEEHPDAPVIRSFPGLAALTGAQVLTEIGDDRTRFATAGSLKAYAGSAPVTRASGKSCKVMSRKVKNQRLAAVGYV